MATQNTRSSSVVTDETVIDDAWFNRMRTKYAQPNEHETIRKIVIKEIDILQAFWHHGLNPEECAREITRPIAETSIPELNTYSDETVALITMWHTITDALYTWPASRIADLLDLLTAIGQLPGSVKVHRGEAMDMNSETSTKQLLFNTYPYFAMVWYRGLRQPGTIVRADARHSKNRSIPPIMTLDEYVRRKDIEAKLIAGGSLSIDKQILRYVTHTLESEPDKHVPDGEAEAWHQNRLEFQVPAIASLVKHCGEKLKAEVFAKGGGEQQWHRWVVRLKEIADDELESDLTKAAAKAAQEGIESIRP